MVPALPTSTTKTARQARSSSLSVHPTPYSAQAATATRRRKQQQPINHLGPPSPFDGHDSPRSPLLSPGYMKKLLKEKVEEAGGYKRMWDKWWKSWLIVLALGSALGAWLLLREPPPLWIPKRPYDLQPYTHLSHSTPLTLPTSTRIIHITKEFGPATMGGLGVMLTSLTLAQSQSPFLTPSVILPHYSFLSSPSTSPFASQITHFVDLRIPILTRNRKKRQIITCPVSLLRWPYPAPVDFLHPSSSSSPDDEPSPPKQEDFVEIYLIGPGDQNPFHVAFQATDAGDVYTAYKPLKQEWKDLWFAKAASELVWLLSHDGARAYHVDAEEGDDGDDERGGDFDGTGGVDGVFGRRLREEEGDDDVGPSTRPRGVDVVHLHGATNAMVAYYLRHKEGLIQDEEDVVPPAIVYTLHDTVDEVEYSNLMSNALTFLDFANETDEVDFRSRLSPYTLTGGRRGTQIFPSSLAIDLADMVTFVSRTIAADLVEGRFEFNMKDLVMPSISQRASEGAFVGITNGVDFEVESKNPFTSPVLRELGISFPRVGSNVTDPSTLYSPPSALTPSERPARLSFTQSKLEAKRHLINTLPQHFQPDDESRPWFLFVGRFQYNKGCQFFEPILRLISDANIPQLDARLVLLGTRNNYPHSHLRQLAQRYPNHLTFIDSLDFQNEWGTVLRMASDFALVPSFSEAFGLVAVEGMLFGMRVVSSGVGGLGEILVDSVAATAREKEDDEEDRDEERLGNSFLFDLYARNSTSGEKRDLGLSPSRARVEMWELEPAVKACEEAVRRAVGSWRVFNAGESEDEWVRREMDVRGLVSNALKLKWSREGGPVEEYVRVYDLAFSSHHHTLPNLNIPHGTYTTPPIAHGGHDLVSGEEGAEVIQNRGDSPLPSHEPAPVLPVYKIWAPRKSPRPKKRLPSPPKKPKKL
ncbi:UDP-Glycosyltransferase/glycogen phosphorylase [Meredithblackwellia eburnea MCA 4105]